MSAPRSNTGDKFLANRRASVRTGYAMLTAMAVVPSDQFSFQLLLIGGQYDAFISSVQSLKLLTAVVGKGWNWKDPGARR